MFPGFDILLTSTAGPSAPNSPVYLGIDLSQETNVAGASVIAIEATGAVPEPGSGAGMVVLTAGLVTRGRRRWGAELEAGRARSV
jgi:hypothetical protein